MKRQKQNFLAAVGALALGLTPSPGWTVEQVGTAATNPSPSVELTSVATNINLATTPSKSVLEVLKMAKSGVAEEAVKAYILNNLSTFNLTADNIIQLQREGVSTSIIMAMLHHDSALRQNGSAPPPPADQPPLPPPDPTQSVTPPANPPTTTDYGDAGAYYNNLAPYGNWSYLPDYGYYWQPYSTFWAAYPGWGYPWWGWLDSGWWFCAGRGWCWFPRFHDHGFGHDHNHGFGFPGHHGDHQFTSSGGHWSGVGNRPLASNNGFRGTGSVGGQNGSQTFGGASTIHQAMTLNLANSGPGYGRGGTGGFGYGMRGGGGGGRGSRGSGGGHR